MSKKPAPKKKSDAVVSRADRVATRNLRRVISHALASGLRNVIRFDVEFFCSGVADPYHRVVVEFYDKASKGKWK